MSAAYLLFVLHYIFIQLSNLPSETSKAWRIYADIILCYFLIQDSDSSIDICRHGGDIKLVAIFLPKHTMHFTELGLDKFERCCSVGTILKGCVFPYGCRVFFFIAFTSSRQHILLLQIHFLWRRIRTRDKYRVGQLLEERITFVSFVPHMIE